MTRQARPEYMANVQGGQHPLYKGLLALAHEVWGDDWGMEACVEVYPSEANGFTTYATATVTTPSGQKFTEGGDANADNTNRQIAKHAARMALTRAKGRALKDALGIGDATAEEMGGEEAVRTSQARPEGQRTGEAPGGRQADAQPRQEQNRGGPATDKQKRYLNVLVDGDLTRLEREAGKPPSGLTRGEASDLIERLGK